MTTANSLTLCPHCHHAEPHPDGVGCLNTNDGRFCPCEQLWSPPGPPSLLVPPGVRTTDVETSHEAFAKVGQAARWVAILELLAWNDRPEGWTADEIAASLDLGRCYWKRIGEVRSLGWAEWNILDGQPIRRGGQRSTRITPAGRAAWERASRGERFAIVKGELRWLAGQGAPNA